MKLAHFDCPFGAAGDMLLAGLLDAGASLAELNEALTGLAIEPDAVSVLTSKVRRCSIEANKVDVQCHEGGNGDHHHHEHHGRSFKDIRAILESSRLPDGALDLSLAIFGNLARAEAHVHGTSVDEIHFHEVGALDALADIVGFAFCYHRLGIERATASPLPMGAGVVKTEHGIFPVPGPAVGYLIEQGRVPTSPLQLPFECLTPTGAAILTTVASSWSGLPSFAHIDNIGYGAGTLDPGDHPNICRVFLGTASKSVWSEGEEDGRFLCELVTVIETDIDDCSPSVLAYACEKLFEGGALDVTVTPTVMKKNRSGHHISVVCRADRREQLASIIMAETSTIGVRCHSSERLVLERDFEVVELPGPGRVRVKVASDGAGRVLNLQPEYSDCADYARARQIPIKEVIDLVIAAYRQQS
ncbi:MAG: nickel pincer cofactor biosynthesis protein LarC [Candidatus Melainabacteria bacterium]|nr:nickel pincer cofactor biosynthesis protein LarC [Candidatus Melainabacteria bacterium]